MKKGVLQEYVLSLILFNLYSHKQSLTRLWFPVYYRKWTTYPRKLAFIRIKPKFIGRNISLPLKLRLIKCLHIHSLAIRSKMDHGRTSYGKDISPWHLDISVCCSNILERWRYKRRSTQTVRNHIHEKKSKLEDFGHLMRHNKYRLQQLFLQGKMDVRIGPSRERATEEKKAIFKTVAFSKNHRQIIGWWIVWLVF